MATLPDIALHWTGANLVWGAFNTIRHALLTNDEHLLKNAVARIAREITVGQEEGIQHDRSFFQHGPRLYAGGYGLAYAEDIARLLYLLQGTEYQLPQDKVSLFLSFVLDGLQYMIHGEGIDYACVGREITRKGVLNSARLIPMLRYLTLTEGLVCKDEISAFLAHLQGNAATDKTKYFENAAMLCHNFHGIYVGAKFMSNRLWGAEICNGEGELCYNMSYGTHTCIMRSGREYQNINPVWDYAHIPGTTSWEEDDKALLARRDWWFRSLPNDCFGGKQNGRRAVIYELSEHDGARALVTHFAFEDGFVCLGAGIHDDHARPLVTTIDQCFVATPPEVTSSAVIHNGIRYSAFQGTAIHTTVRKQIGSWKRNHAGMSDIPVSGEVLTMTVSHPVEEDGTYAYMISASHLPKPPVTILRNDLTMQAIRLPSGDILAVFHQTTILKDEETGQVLSGQAREIFC